LPTFFNQFYLLFLYFFLQMHLTKPKESVDILLLKIRLIGPFIVHQ